VPTVESIAASGYGVLDTLYKVTEIATKRIRENLSGQKNAVKLQAVQKDDRESESSVVDEHLSRIHKVRPEEEAAAERMKAAGRLRPDDVDSFLLEFVDRDDDLSLDDGLPAPPSELAEPPPSEPTLPPPRFEEPGAPPSFAEAQPAAGKKGSRKGDKRATARPAAPPERRPTAAAPTTPAPTPPLSADAGTEADVFVAPAALAEPAPGAPEPAAPSLSNAATLPPVSQANARTIPPAPAPDEPPARPRSVSLPPTPVLPDPRPSDTRTPARARYPEGPPIDARVDARLLSGVLLREVLGSTVGADGRATIEIVLERDGAARRHPLRFVESQPETPWGSISVAAIGALVLGFLGGLLVGWQFL